MSNYVYGSVEKVIVPTCDNMTFLRLSIISTFSLSFPPPPVRVLHRLLEWRNHGNPWPSVLVHHGDLLPYVVKRMNEASGPYQMFGELGDVLAFRFVHSHRIILFFFFFFFFFAFIYTGNDTIWPTASFRCTPVIMKLYLSTFFNTE